MLYLVTQFTDVSVFALNLITGLGLGLGIDYALLIVNRYREELARTNDVNASVIKTVTTAGRTVFFSGLTVALVLASMILFPQYFLKSFAYAGVSVVLFAVLASLISISQVFVAGKIAKNADKWPNEIQNVINDVQDNVIKELEENNVNIKIESNGETVEINASSLKKDKEQKLEDLEAGSTQKDDTVKIEK